MAVSFQKTLRPIIGSIALLGVIMEFFHAAGRGTGVVDFFSYFTIQSNLLVFICGFAGITGRRSFFNGPGFFGLALLNISLTGFIFFLLLRNSYVPTGIGVYSNMLLHYMVPFLMIAFFFMDKDRFAFRYVHVLYWVLYSIVYLAYTMIRGSVIHRYPYPFMDLMVLSAGQVVLNIAMIASGFLIFSLLLVAVSRKVHKIMD